MAKITVRYHDYGIKSKLTKKLKGAQGPLDLQVAKDSNFYVPVDTHNLEDSVQRSPFGSGRVVWDTPYAAKVYYGTEMHFSKDQNPNARALWFEEAKATKAGEWADLVAKYL